MVVRRGAATRTRGRRLVRVHQQHRLRQRLRQPHPIRAEASAVAVRPDVVAERLAHRAREHRADDVAVAEAARLRAQQTTSIRTDRPCHYSIKKI